MKKLARIAHIKRDELLSQFVFFNMSFAIVDIVLWSFYAILLYRATGQFEALILDRLIHFTSLWIGFVNGSFLVNRFGYRNIFRLSFLLQSVSALLVVVFLSEISSMYIFFAVILGFPRGIYWATHHYFNLKELHGVSREVVINISQGVKLVLSILLPILAGSLITLRGDYKLVFFLSAIIYFFASVFPFRFNKVPQSKLTMKEVVMITKKKCFNKYSLLTMLITVFNTIFTLLFSIVPFLLIRDEFGVGALASFVGIIAAFISIFECKISYRNRIKIGLLGYFILGIVNVVFSVIWSLPSLFLRSIGVTLSTATSDTIENAIDYETRELILGNFKNESALEMNLINETLHFTARIVTLTTLYLVVSGAEEIIQLIRALIIVLAFGRFALFLFQVRFKMVLRK
jgi:hypothetical protein